MEIFLQQLLNGLTIGSVYSLVALGLTLVYGILHVPNFAHGAFYMMGGFIAYYLISKLGFGYWIAMIGAAFAVAILSMLAEFLVFKPLSKAPPLHDMIAAIGIMLFLESLAQLLWGADFQRMPSPYTGMVDILGLTVSLQRLLIIAGAFILVVCLHLFLHHTMLGSSIIALAQNKEGAILVGINPIRTTYLVFAVAGILATVAAVLYAPINLVYPSMGQIVITKSFVIIVMGGMGSFVGAIVGGMIIGFAESFGGYYLSPDYKDVIAFLLLVLVLSIRPQGLFAKGVR